MKFFKKYKRHLLDYHRRITIKKELKFLQKKIKLSTLRPKYYSTPKIIITWEMYTPNLYNDLVDVYIRKDEKGFTKEEIMEFMKTHHTWDLREYIAKKTKQQTGFIEYKGERLEYLQYFEFRFR